MILTRVEKGWKESQTMARRSLGGVFNSKQRTQNTWAGSNSNFESFKGNGAVPSNRRWVSRVGQKSSHTFNREVGLVRGSKSFNIGSHSMYKDKGLSKGFESGPKEQEAVVGNVSAHFLPLL